MAGFDAPHYLAALLQRVQAFVRASSTENFVGLPSDGIDALVDRMAGTPAALDLFDAFHELHGRYVIGLIQQDADQAGKPGAHRTAAGQLVKVFLELEENLMHQHLVAQMDRRSK